MKIAVVHDWMVGGGAEKVVERILKLYPDSVLYTSCITPEWREKLKHTEIRTGYLDGRPFRKLRKFLPNLRQKWFENLDLTDFDLIISSSGAEAKGVKNIKPGTLHVNYCHSPTHYYWVRYEEYIKNPGFGVLNPIARLGLKILVGRNRKWDYRAAQRPDVMIANSTCVQQRIKKFYDRESEVIFPPVDTARFASSRKSEFISRKLEAEHRTQDVEHIGVKRLKLVMWGRHVPYKRFDLAIEACNRLNVELSIVGDGPETSKLKAIAGPTIKFLGRISDEELEQIASRSDGFLFPSEEDFGISPVEAMAAGLPVVALKAGGALDYVVEGKTGVFFENQTVESLIEAIERLAKTNFDRQFIATQSHKFRAEIFDENFQRLIGTTLKGSSDNLNKSSE